MSGRGTGSNSTDGNANVSWVPKTRCKIAQHNKSDSGWKNGRNIQGNGRKVKCNYCLKIASEEVLHSSIV